jgi:hypothetical protein
MLPAASHQVAMAITAVLLILSDPSSLHNDLIRYALIVIGWDLAVTIAHFVTQRRSRAAETIAAKTASQAT